MAAPPLPEGHVFRPVVRGDRISGEPRRRRRSSSATIDQHGKHAPIDGWWPNGASEVCGLGSRIRWLVSSECRRAIRHGHGPECVRDALHRWTDESSNNDAGRVTRYFFSAGVSRRGALGSAPVRPAAAVNVAYRGCFSERRLGTLLRVAETNRQGRFVNTSPSGRMYGWWFRHNGQYEGSKLANTVGQPWSLTSEVRPTTSVGC